MPRALIDAALVDADRLDASIRTALWLHAARVMTPFDRDEAERLLGRGISAALALTGADREPLVHTAVSMAATITPVRAIELAARELTSHVQSGAVTQAFFHILNHGRAADAVAILNDLPTALS